MKNRKDEIEIAIPGRRPENPESSNDGNLETQEVCTENRNDGYLETENITEGYS